MSPDSKDSQSASYTVCPKCGADVLTARIQKHLRKAHDPRRERLELLKDNVRVVEKARTVFFETAVRCTDCEAKVELKIVRRHYAEVHSAAVPAEMLAILGLAEPQNTFKSDREREAYWRKIFGIDRPSSQEYFERTKIVSAGAFELGKNRKH